MTPRHLSLLPPVILLLAGAACGGRPAEGGRGGVGFVDRTREAGIDFVNHTGFFDRKDYVVDAKGGGVLSLDYDGDGDVDLYFVDGNSFHLDAAGVVVTKRANPEAGNRLYQNDGLWRFTDVTSTAGVGDRSYGVGGTVGDYDNDGDPDIYICNWGRNVLYENRGDGTFRDVTARAGVAGSERAYSTCAAFFDADGDGDLDLYVSNYCDLEGVMRARRGKPPGDLIRGVWRYAGPLVYRPQRDVFFRNLGDGTFRDDTDLCFPDQGNHPAYGFQALPFDVEGDGDTDLYVANDSTPNFLWVNDGTGVFRERAEDAGVARNECNLSQAGMGTTAGDFDQDGRVDILVSNFACDWNTLYRNRSGGGRLRFEDVTLRRGLGLGAFDRVSWGVALRDFNRDGWLDIFVSNGHVYPTPSPGFRFQGGTYEQTPNLFLGTGPPKWKFRDVSEEAGPGMRIPRLGRGASFADLDGDGDVDVCAACLDGPPLLLENRLPAKGHWFELRLAGHPSNRDGIGARVTVEAGEGPHRVRQIVDHSLAGSFGSSPGPRLHWGLGPADRVDRLIVRWPSGLVQEFTGLPADRCLWLAEGGAAPEEED